MKKLVIATQNRDKFKEMREALTGAGWDLLPAFDFPGMPEVVEDGQTLEENSLKKAQAVSSFTGLPALADDTGLFVEALDGRPGIYAARFAGENCSYLDNVAKLLDSLKKIPGSSRKAVFRTVVTLFFPEDKPRQVVGEVAGEIVEEARGSCGFGYDPVFKPLSSSKVFSEMSVEEKNILSHRGKAVREARKLLEEI